MRFEVKDDTITSETLGKTDIYKIVKNVAQFDTLVLAEDFVNLVILKDTRDRFKIEHINKEV